MTTNNMLLILNTMSKSAHTYNPINDSFEERVRAYKTAIAAYRNWEFSNARKDNSEWSDRIGTPEELEDAGTILTNSLELAKRTVTSADVKKAEKVGWLDDEDIKLIARFEREQEMKAERQRKKDQQSSHNNRFTQ